MHNGETFDLANELMGVMELAAAAVVNYAEIYPFGYDPNGAGSFTETVTLFYEDGKTHKTLDKTGIVIKMTDGRADAAVSAKNISVPYGSNVKAPAGLELGADFGTKPTANNYPKTSVFSRGSETVKPGRTTVNVSIYEEEAAISMDSFFYKEHVNTDKNPVASSKAELIQIIAGLDITAEDTDLDIVFRNPKDSNVTVKNVNPEVYVKLPTSLIAVKDTLVGLIEELEGMDKAPNLGAMTGGKLSHEQVMALLKSDLHDITKEYTWDDFASLLDVMVGFAVDDADSNPKLDRILDLIKNQTNLETTGEIRVFFTDDAYPKKPGAYANIAIAMDNNYLNGLFDLDEVAGEKAKLTLGKDYGIILISPVLVQPNKGIQLKHSEFEDAQNIYEMFSDDAAKGWLVYDKNGNDVTASTELFYYGFNNELAVHYDGNTEDEKDDGKILPTKPGIYYVSAICRDAENKVVGTDLAVLIIGMEKATIDVIGVEEFYEPGVEHKPVIVVENEKGEELYESGKAGLTIISGTVTKNEGATLKDLKAEVNIDFPAKLDNALAAAYEYVTGNELGKGGITAASMTQSDLIAALEWIVDKIEERTLNNKLAQWGLAPDILKDKVLDKLDQKLESPETKAVNTINKLIAKIDEFELDDNAEITFKNKKGYEENGIYLYYAMITDPNYFVDIRSATDPSAVVDAMTGIVIVKGDLIMDDQTVVYTGEGQMPVVTAENMAKAYGMFFMVYDEQKHSISFVLDNDLNAVRTKLEQYMTINGKTIGELFGAANEKIPELAELIMDGITEEAVARIPGLETSSYFQNAKDKLEARLAKHGASMLKAIENKLLSLSDVLDKNTELTFNVKPTEVGTYKVHAFSYGIAHEDATFTIVEESELFDVDWKATMNLGNDLRLNIYFRIPALDGAQNLDEYTVRLTRSFMDGINKGRQHIIEGKLSEISQNDEKYFRIAYSHISATQMCDEFYMEIFDANGNAVIKPYTESIRKYCMRAIESYIENGSAPVLYVDILNYGAEAQHKWEYNEDDLANSLMTAEQAAYATGDIEVKTTGTEITGERHQRPTLSLQNKILFNFYFENIENASRAVVEYTDYKNRPYSSEVAFDVVNGKIKVQFEKLVAADYQCKMTCTLYDEQGNKLAYATDSAENYLFRAITASNDPLYYATYKYMQSSFNHFK